MHFKKVGGGASDKLALLKNGVIQNDTLKLTYTAPGRATQQNGYLYLDDNGNNGGSAYITVQNVDLTKYNLIVIDSECPCSNTYYPINIYADSNTVKLSAYNRKTSYYDISNSFKIGCVNFENGNSTFKLYNAYLLKL